MMQLKTYKKPYGTLTVNYKKGLKMFLELDDEFGDEIVRQGLLESYFMIKYDQKRVKEGAYAHPDDIVKWKEVLAAMEIVGEWYFVDFEKAKKEFKRKKK